jgi:hypothetical protein
MSKLDEKIELYTKFVADHKLDIDSEFLAKVTKGLGPSIYKKDAESVACSHHSELETVVKNFLKKKLGLELDDKVLMDAAKEVCQEIGSSERHKYRAVFYALLAIKFDKTSIYA